MDARTAQALISPTAPTCRTSFDTRAVRMQLFRDGQFVRQFTTDAEGVAEVDGLSPGRYVLREYPPQGALPLVTRDLVLAAGENW